MDASFDADGIDAGNMDRAHRSTREGKGPGRRVRACGFGKRQVRCDGVETALRLGYR